MVITVYSLFLFELMDGKFEVLIMLISLAYGLPSKEMIRWYTDR